MQYVEGYQPTAASYIAMAKLHVRSYRAYMQYAPKRAPEVQTSMRRLLAKHDIPEIRALANLIGC